MAQIDARTQERLNAVFAEFSKACQRMVAACDAAALDIAELAARMEPEQSAAIERLTNDMLANAKRLR